MALSIGGRSGGDYGFAGFLRLGERLGVLVRAVRQVLSELVDRCDLWLGDLSALPFDQGRIAKLRRLISHRLGRLAPPRVA